MERKGDEFYACLDEERNWWYILLREIVCGKRVSDKMKDPYILQEAATHVRLLDAVIGSSEDETAPHSDFLDDAIVRLAHFTRSKDSPEIFSLPHDDQLCSNPQVHRLNPTAGDGERQTVEALCFVAGKTSEMEHAGPRLWAGLGNGKVVVFDATTWDEIGICLEVETRISCLAWVAPSGSEKKMWVSCFDSVIYVVDGEDLSCHQQAKGHNDIIVGLSPNPDGSRVHSMSIDGAFVEWNSLTLESLRVFQLPSETGPIFSFHVEIEDNTVWACGRQKLLQCKINIVKNEISVKKVLQLKSKDGTFFPTNCFLITEDQVWIGSSDGHLGLYDKQKCLLRRHLEVNCGTHCKGFSQMILSDGKVWAPSKCGLIQVFEAVSGDWLTCIRGHDAAIRSICAAGQRYILTGAESKDGHIKVWRTQFEIQKQNPDHST